MVQRQRTEQEKTFSNLKSFSQTSEANWFWRSMLSKHSSSLLNCQPFSLEGDGPVGNHVPSDEAYSGANCPFATCSDGFTARTPRYILNHVNKKHRGQVPSFSFLQYFKVNRCPHCGLFAKAQRKHSRCTGYVPELTFESYQRLTALQDGDAEDTEDEKKEHKEADFDHDDTPLVVCHSTLRKLPHLHWAAWSACVRRISQKLLNADHNNRHDAFEDAIIDLLDLPGKALRRPGRGGQKGFSAIGRRIDDDDDFRVDRGQVSLLDRRT